MKRLACLAIFLTAGAVAADQLSGVGQPFWANRLAATTSAACVTIARGSSVCALFSAGTTQSWRSAHVAVVQSSAAGRCCWSGASGLEMTDFELSDASGPNGTGQCAGFALMASGRYDARPSREDVAARAGGRAGLCSLPSVAGGDSLYAPCTPGAGGDSVCNALTTNATCVAEASWTQVMRDAAGVFLLCETDSGTGNIDVVKERVRR